MLFFLLKLATFHCPSDERSSATITSTLPGGLHDTCSSPQRHPHLKQLAHVLPYYSFWTHEDTQIKANKIQLCQAFQLLHENSNMLHAYVAHIVQTH
jgi:hypothetical protein